MSSPVSSSTKDDTFSFYFTFTLYVYCKFKTFHENFIFGNSVENMRRLNDLHTLVNSRVVSPFRKDFNIANLRNCEVVAKFRENKTLVKISELRVIYVQKQHAAILS